MQLRADDAYWVEALGVRQWNCRTFMCPWCDAHRDGHLSWHNFSLDAPWYGTCRTHEKFFTDMQFSVDNNFRPHTTPFAYRPNIVDAPHFEWIAVMLDWMHDADMGVVPAEWARFFGRFCRASPHCNMTEGMDPSLQCKMVMAYRKFSKAWFRWLVTI